MCAGDAWILRGRIGDKLELAMTIENSKSLVVVRAAHDRQIVRSLLILSDNDFCS
jgi:hypothetical protein